jgi:cytochrome c-type biogenesis protein CcmF
LQVRQALVPPLAGAALAAAVAAALGVRRPWTLVALAFGGYTLQVTLRELWLPLARRRRAHGESLGRALVEAGFVRGRRRLGSYIVHAGAAVVIVAIAVSSTMGTSREAQLRVGEKTSVGAYTLTFLAVDQVSEPHREAVVARVGVSRGGRELGVLLPRMNQYERQREPIGTPAVRSSLFEDLYLSVMNIDAASGSLGLLAMVNPMVGWIWAATALMAIGSLVSLVPSRADTRP